MTARVKYDAARDGVVKTKKKKKKREDGSGGGKSLTS